MIPGQIFPQGSKAICQLCTPANAESDIIGPYNDTAHTFHDHEGILFL